MLVNGNKYMKEQNSSHIQIMHISRYQKGPTQIKAVPICKQHHRVIIITSQESVLQMVDYTSDACGGNQNQPHKQ